ncbi:MAG TPA: glycogen synthase GlgA [Azospirillaceae bacterium]|nr:glycogen synthase GlgA [Azospirillaceae bacterium]
MRILHVVSEIYPLVKTGGLADVAGALPAAQARLGADVRVLVPGYPQIQAALTDVRTVASDANLFHGGPAQLREGTLKGVDVPAYVLDCAGLYWRAGSPYFDQTGHEWADNHRRFAALGWAAAQLAANADPDWQPDIVHGHDWQAGLGLAFIALRGGWRPGLVTTIHNLAFQGRFPASVVADLGLSPQGFSMFGYEFHGDVSFLKAALYYADRITTVSRTYAQEIQEPEQGFGLDGLLRSRAADLVGIVNGVDYDVWDPSRDSNLPRPFDRHDRSGKAEAKAELQRRMGLSVDPDQPLFVLVGRLTTHKGVHLLLEATPALVASGAQLAVLGSGERDKEDGFRYAAGFHPGQVAAVIGFDEGLAHLFQGGADVTLVPSLTEPCGLTQLYAMRYGSLPLVRRAGGLNDTVINADPGAIEAGTATGFVFNDATPQALAGTIGWAAGLYRDKALWSRLQNTAMAQDFGWPNAAGEYLRLYHGLRPSVA